MSGIRMRSLAEQAGRLSVLGILVAVLAFTAVVAPRQGDQVLDAYLKQTVAGMSPGARSLQGAVDATTFDMAPGPGSNGITIAPTWNAMPKTLLQARAQMPEALREVTRPGHYLGRAAPTAGTLANGFGGFPVQKTVPDAPAGRQLLAVEGYPELKTDARLVSGSWPGTPTHRIDPVHGTDTLTIPVVIADAAAKALHWKVGQAQEIATDPFAVVLVLSGTVSPQATGSDFWAMSRTRSNIVTFTNADGEIFHAGVVWTDPGSWPDVAPFINGGSTFSWFPVSPARTTLAHLDALQNALTTTLAQGIPVHDGTQDDKVIRLGSALPQMLNLYDNTVASTRTVLTVATIAALGLGVLVLLAAITLTLRARRPVRELLRTRGASAARLAGSSAADVAVWTVPAALVGAVAGILLVPSISGVPVVGMREIVAVVSWAVLPVLLAAGAVLVELLPPRLAAILRQSRWVGEALLVLLAVAAVIVTVTGGSDAATALAGIAVGLAASVLMLRVLPVVLGWVTGVVRRGGAAVFIGLRDAAGAGWLVVASVTATATGVLALALGMSAARAQQKNVTPGPLLLAPGALTVVAAAVALCIVFAATAFAVSVAASRGPRRARAADLRRIGYSGRQRSRVSLWGTIPLVIVSIAVGALVGAWSATPVLGAVAAASGQAVAIVVSPVAVLAVAVGILVLIVIIEAVALATDARATASTARRGS
ncbi:hypothetical protein LK09_10210 [Microbacterium mangrovi]|uniref:Permease n=1 Tax=Microbacterium mangrovi TaxID=1348253 RepID=A0A0B2A895_9MICO|nr:hypothetical protein [Microbacterium mangrovi]KHK97836.1 hypothetical protein LK09_10210 [Microbacterium mangrovi]